MKLKLRLLSFLLVFVLTAGSLSQVNAYADEKSGTEDLKELLATKDFTRFSGFSGMTANPE